MNVSQRLDAVAAYMPVLGWLYVYLARRNSPLAMFHLRQSIGLFLALLTVVAGWAVAAWLLAWVPYAYVLSIALFALVIAAAVCGVVAWLVGIIGALRGRVVFLPVSGRMAERLPIRSHLSAHANPRSTE